MHMHTQCVVGNPRFVFIKYVFNPHCFNKFDHCKYYSGGPSTGINKLVRITIILIITTTIIISRIILFIITPVCALLTYAIGNRFRNTSSGARPTPG